jgi:hypothetical protein
MKKIAPTLAAVSIAGLALAPLASADPAPGVYTAAIIDSGKSNKTGSVPGWSINPCGPDCIHVGTASASGGFDLHRNGSGWTGPSSDGPGTWSLEENSMVLTLTDPELVVAIALMR